MSDAKSTPLPEPIEDAIEADDRAARRGRLGVLSIAVAILFGLFYAYDLFEAISNTVLLNVQIHSLNDLQREGGIALTSVPWLILVLDLLAPPLVYVIAFVVGLRKNLLSKVLVFLLGLAVVAAVTLSLENGFVKFFL